ncbi:hypothetical protein [Burkholderia sp. Z1]|uniref:hypothetical protein n=1 Tax=Burkholderia sp. Z1 TaxID=2759039 RepID=UPI0018691417|nr:hypothetical protein [Burkholderia sp. Z1]
MNGRKTEHSSGHSRGHISRTYRNALLAAHEGEVSGRSFFSEMAGHYRNDSYARRAFSILSEVEHETGQLMLDLLVKHRVACSDRHAAEVKGLVVAWLLRPLGWHALLDAMGQRITPALHRFEALRGIAPADDRASIELLLEHERALYAFVQRDVSRTNDALRPSLRYLRRLRSATHVAR